MNVRQTLLALVGLLCCLQAAGCMDPVEARAGADRTVAAGEVADPAGDAHPAGGLQDEPAEADALYEAFDLQVQPLCQGTPLEYYYIVKAGGKGGFAVSRGRWSGCADLNREPLGPEPSALPIELHPDYD